MSVTIEKSDGSTLVLLRARLTADEFAYDRRTSKVPYQTNEANDHVLEGSGRRSPESVLLIAEIHASTISNARDGVETVIQACRDAAVISGGLGEWPVEGVQTISRQPAENGYVLRVRLLAAQRRGAGYLRFIGGPVWGLR